MELKDRFGNAIVLLVVSMLWMALIGVAIWLVFGWLEDRWGSSVAILTFGLSAGVVVAVVMWVASSRHTSAIYRTALSFAADSQQMAVDAQRSLAVVQREQARGDTYTARANAQMQVSTYRALLSDVRRHDRMDAQESAPVPAATWAMAEDVQAGDGDFQWMQ